MKPDKEPHAGKELRIEPPVIVPLMDNKFDAKRGACTA